MDVTSFSVGEIITYKPSYKGYYYDVNTPPRLVPGHQYRISMINGNAITVEFYDHAGGGLYWSEFAQIASSPFVVGDVITYAPTERGRRLDLNKLPEERLVPGKQYKVVGVLDDSFISVEGYYHLTAGIPWMEFTQPTSNPFSEGDVVIYRPTERSTLLNSKSPPEARLVPGQQYEVAGIDGNYVLVKWDYFLEGRIYWSEYEPVAGQTINLIKAAF